MTGKFSTKWIIENSQGIIGEYTEGITVRQLYYRLVAIGMTNDFRHYKKVVYATTQARWEGKINLNDFIDRERSMIGSTLYEKRELKTKIESAKSEIERQMNSYYLNRWSNQDNYIEVWIEKKALQGVFEGVCIDFDVGLAPCKGYPSLTFLNEARERFMDAENTGKNIIILYFGDYDPSGEDISRSIKANLSRMGIEIELIRIGLTPETIKKLKLPGVPPKKSDTRTIFWDGESAVELDAVEPRTLKEMCKKAIKEYFNEENYNDLIKQEKEERGEYQEELKYFFLDNDEEIKKLKGKIKFIKDGIDKMLVMLENEKK